MSAPAQSRPTSLLPPRATTGIGSLPHTQLELALQSALQLDIPYLPQLPRQSPAELMIPAALEGVPGLSFDPEGMCTIDLDAWRQGRERFAAQLESALLMEGRGWEAFLPSAEACRAWRPFLWEVEHRKLALAKVQLAGPFTVRWVAKAASGEPVAEVAELDQPLFRLMLAKCLAMVRALREVNTTPLLYLDEPGLYALERTQPRHVLALQEIKLLATALQREGAIVAIHCCSNTDWERILALGVDVISLDVRLSLDALLEQRRALGAFLDQGGVLSLGIIPTNLDATFEVRELVDAVQTSFAATLPSSRAQALLDRVLLTPACGLAMRTVADAERTMDQLRQAQRMMGELAAG